MGLLLLQEAHWGSVLPLSNLIFPWQGVGTREWQTSNAMRLKASFLGELFAHMCGSRHGPSPSPRSMGEGKWAKTGEVGSATSHGGPGLKVPPSPAFLKHIPCYSLALDHLGLRPQCLLPAQVHLDLCLPSSVSWGATSGQCLWWLPGQALPSKLTCQTCGCGCHLDILSSWTFKWLMPSHSLAAPTWGTPNENLPAEPSQLVSHDCKLLL